MTRWVRPRISFDNYILSFSCVGQLEETISSSFHRASNLRSLLSKADTPEALKHCEPMFSKLVHSNSTGTLMAEIHDLSSRVQDQDIAEGAISDSDPSEESGDPGSWNSKLATAMSPELRQAFQRAFPGGSPTHAHFTSQTTISGFVHSTRQKHQGNSQVLYAQRQGMSTPGFIQSIFRIENDSRQFLAVRRLLPSTVNDPFRPWPLLGVKLYANSVGELDVISPEDVQFQYASCPLKWEETENIAVISLSRVSTVEYFHGAAGPYYPF